ncbi:MAG: hypothetical protein ACREOS_13460 [Candidatus Dormibacteraceae bacterium]
MGSLYQRLTQSTGASDSPRDDPRTDPDASPITRPRRLRLRARTLERWIEGTVQTVHPRLIDLLNGADGGGLIVAEDVSIAVDDGARSRTPAASSTATLNTNTWLFASPLDDDDRSGRDSFERVSKYIDRARVGIGPYDIVGEIHLIPDTTLQTVQILARARFVVLTGATIERDRDRPTSTPLGVVCVNLRLVDFIAPIA